MGRHLKTKPRNVRRGFTLMEVLVASSIFAVVMVFVTGAVVASSNYQSKIRIMNQTSEESRRLADMITRDVRSANYPLTITASEVGSTEAPKEFKFKNGVAILSSSLISNNKYTSLVEDVDVSQTGPNILIISLKGKCKIYYTKRTDSTNYGLYYKEIDNNNALNATTLTINPTNDLISKEKLNVDIRFGGYAPDDKSLNLGQPMIKFYISVGSQNEGTYNYYKTAIRSAVTSRSYNE